MTPTSYNVFPLPIPLTDAHIHKYAALRLSSLQTNPECFSSTYERESSFTMAKWRERLDSTGMVTIIASILSEEDGRGTPGSEWVGMATIVGPDMLPVLPFRAPEGSEYVLGGMWVHPEHRLHGLGKTLIKGAFDWVRGVGVGQSTARGVHKKVLSLKVYSSNEDAIALYERMGFKRAPSPVADVDSDSEVNFTVWMTADVE